MNWQRDMHLTTEQIEFVKCAGGSVKITSHVSGATYNYLIQTTSRGKGLIVKHIENNNQHYVGYLPFNGHAWLVMAWFTPKLASMEPIMRSSEHSLGHGLTSIRTILSPSAC
jgi:hypothetical protein